MQQRSYRLPAFQFKEDEKRFEPFPPSYYETEKRAQEKITQMMTSPKRKKLN
ncbi:hypothetical protein LJC04_00990 [Ruminococcaceae bacterium OttesenSCG-928-O06]|nr:hypothetical protein [Ruminococcaceae bacterium OttesenSCG-928-O06]